MPSPPSLLDRAIAYVSPGWALERQSARARADFLASGYSSHGASTTKKSFQGWQTVSAGPDEDIVANIERLRERSRDLWMGDAIARGALRTLRTNVVGPGLRLNAQIDHELLGLTPEAALEWETSTEREFGLWADTVACDAERRSNFGELQALAHLSQLMSGDVFALLPLIDRPGDRYQLKVRLIEADRVSNPWIRDAAADIVGGVEVGPNGDPIAYYITNRHPGDLGSGALISPLLRWQRVPAFGAETGEPLVLHLMESERPGQRRGVPILSPVLEKLKQLGRYSDAEIMAAVVAGMFTAAITTEAPQSPLSAVIPTAQQVSLTDTDDAANTYQLGNGALLGLLPGEKLEAVNPSRPNSSFEPFVQAVCRQIGAGLGVPYEVLLMQFTASYSASRGALLEFWKHIHVGRSWLAAKLCQPVYQAWLAEAVARGFVSAPGFFADPMIRAAWSRAEWHGPSQGQLDPTKEVEAATQRVAEGFSTRQRETRELTGGDYWSFVRQRQREEQARKAAGLAPEPAPPPGAPGESPDEEERAPATEDDAQTEAA